MDKFENVIKSIKLMLERDSKDNESLIVLANQAVYHLLLASTITANQTHTLSNLCLELHSYTARNNCNNASEYGNAHIENTVDYKIARELVLKFKNLHYEFLKECKNHYYYDVLMCYECIKQMIQINPMEGYIEGIGYNQPHLFDYTLERDLRGVYLNSLIKLNPKWADIERLVSSGYVLLKYRKELVRYVIENKLLDNLPEKDFYLHLFEKVIMPANDLGDYHRLSEQERENLRKRSVVSPSQT